MENIERLFGQTVSLVGREILAPIVTVRQDPDDGYDADRESDKGGSVQSVTG